MCSRMIAKWIVAVFKLLLATRAFEMCLFYISCLTSHSSLQININNYVYFTHKPGNRRVINYFRLKKNSHNTWVVTQFNAELNKASWDYFILLCGCMYVSIYVWNTALES
jgi:hypothetical protein